MNEDKTKQSEPRLLKRRSVLLQLTSGIGLGILGFHTSGLSGCQTGVSTQEGEGNPQEGGTKQEPHTSKEVPADTAAKEIPQTIDEAGLVHDAGGADEAHVEVINDKDELRYPDEPTHEIPSDEEPIFDSSPPDARLCKATEANIEGPFYRQNAPWLSKLVDDKEPGIHLAIAGIVLGPDCQTPLPNIVVDVWQADDKGSYDNDGKDDPAMGIYHLRGRMRTNAKGEYAFTSIIPGRYLNGAVFRPAHIHYKVYGTGFQTLTTQLYFEGDPYLKGDPFYHPSLVIPLQTVGTGRRGIFPIVLKKSA